MKLLLDENLSHRLISDLEPLFPGSAHVSGVGLLHADDQAIWDFAKQNDFTIVTKDEDFEIRAIALGHPPRVIRLKSGNGPRREVLALLRAAQSGIQHFAAADLNSVLVLE